MTHNILSVEDLTAEERVELMGRLWDSLDPAVAAPISAGLGRELDRREAEVDADPDGGDSWADVRASLEKRLR